MFNCFLLAFSCQIFGFGNSEDAFELLADKVEFYELENGLRVLALPLGEAPVAAFRVTVDVGAIDEDLGLTGLAHFAEHMAFKGSRRIGGFNWLAEEKALRDCDIAWKLYEQAKFGDVGDDDGQLQSLLEDFQRSRAIADSYSRASHFDKAVENAGGLDQNASTSTDFTEYYVSLPISEMETWFWLTREQLGDPVMREFYKERDVVMEERRMRTDSNPFGSLLESVLQASFVAHPYRDSVIGHMDDIANLDRPEMLRFWKKHYTANRMIVSVVGRIDPDQVFSFADKYFSDFPVGLKGRARRTVEPVQRGVRTVEIIRPVSPLILIAWHIPSMVGRAKIVYEALGDLLAGGPSSRWHNRLVERERIASGVESFSGYPGRIDPTLFFMSGSPMPDVSFDAFVAAVQDEVERLALEGPSAREVEGLRRRAKANLLMHLDTKQGLAGALAEAELFDGGWEHLFSVFAEIETLSRQDLQEAAEALLSAQRVLGYMHSSEEVEE